MGPYDGNYSQPKANTGGGMDPFSIGLGALGGISNMLSGSAQRKQQQRMYDQQRQDEQRNVGMQDAQFRAGLGFQRDQDRYGRAQDMYNVGRTEEADQYRRANTNALAPARQQLLAQLMARFGGGDMGQWLQQFGSQPAVTQRPDVGALQQAAAKEYTRVESPVAAENAATLSTIEQQARQRAEGSIQNKMRQFARGERDPQEYAARLGFDFNDPANRDKWIEAFLADDAEYQKLKQAQASQSARLGAGQGAY